LADQLQNQAAETIEFVWSGQSGLFELARRQGNSVRRELYATMGEAVGSLEGKDYFAPLARKSWGSTKQHVADNGNVLWADIDELAGLEERLARIPVRPSFIVTSGRKGYWAFWKLATPISTDQIELCNRGLAHLLEADRGVWDKARLARLPGSYRHETGRSAEVAEFSRAVYEPELFAFLDHYAPPETAADADVEGFEPQSASYIPFPDIPKLAQQSRQYMRARPKTPHNKGGTYDRSREEYRIFLALVYQGWTDEEIIHFADVYRLPRHSSEWARRRTYAWTARSLARARAYAVVHPAPPQAAVGVATQAPSAQSNDILARHRRRRQMLELVCGQTTNDLIAEAESTVGMSRAAAYRMLKKLTDSGYVRKERQRRKVLNHLTEEGKLRLVARGPSVPFLDAPPGTDLPNLARQRRRS
jgi:DNA-binding transcriptional ArsR family regulator